MSLTGFFFLHCWSGYPVGDYDDWRYRFLEATSGPGTVDVSHCTWLNPMCYGVIQMCWDIVGVKVKIKFLYHNTFIVTLSYAEAPGQGSKGTESVDDQHNELISGNVPHLYWKVWKLWCWLCFCIDEVLYMFLFILLLWIVLLWALPWCEWYKYMFVWTQMFVECL